MIKGFSCPILAKVSFEECLSHAASHPDECPFTYPILLGMVNNIRGEVEGISVTSMLNCLRKVVLEQRRDIYLDPAQLYFAFRGQLFHAIVQAAQIEGCICEQRFKRQVAGITISGQPDVIYPEHKKLVDYKSTRRVPKRDEPYANHTMQVNIYRWLVAPLYQIDNLEIVYLDMSTVKRISVPVLGFRKVVPFIIGRAKVLKRGLEGGRLPARVGPDGLWQCNGYCEFTSFCWPKGVPTRQQLRERERAKVKAIRRARAKKEAGK